MKVYIVSIRKFFISHNTDYAMAVDLEDDFTLFKSRKNAMNKAEELMNDYRNRYSVEEECISDKTSNFTMVFKRNDGSRYVFSVTEKEVY